MKSFMKRLVATVGLLLAAAGTFAGDSTLEKQLITDPGFERTKPAISPRGICLPPLPINCVAASSFRLLTTSPAFAHSGSGYVTMGGLGMAHSDVFTEGVTIPRAENATLRFHLRVETSERTSRSVDLLSVVVRDESGTLLEVLATYSNLDASRKYSEQLFDVSRYAGRAVQIVFEALEDHSSPTSFLLDDLTLTVE